jgi:type VI secretion system protein ImpJ
MDAHEIPDQIQWHEGLLLTPQHFQQLSLRQETLLQYLSSTVAPFYWGVRHLKIDPSSLVSGLFRVLELEAVMPDGLVVSSGLRRDSELAVTLRPDQMKERPVPVHLAVVARETDLLTEGDLRRYHEAEGEPVVDELTGEGQVRIPRLRPRLMLLVTEKPPRKYVSFPIAKVEHKNDSFFLTDFIPPRLSVTPQSELGIMCLLATSRLREKAVYLAEQAQTPSEGARARMDIRTETLLRGLVAPLPMLEAMLNAGASHPFQIYLALCSVLGSLSVMGWSPVPPLLAPYDHNDLRATFRQVLDHISRKIEEGITSSFTVHPFRYAEGIYSLNFEGEWMNKRLAIGIRGQTGMSEADIVRWGRECLIGSRRNFREMRENRTTGARREQVERSGDLVPPRGVVLFSLNADPRHVEPDEVLQIFNASERPGSPRPAEIVLYVRNSQPQARD